VNRIVILAASIAMLVSSGCFRGAEREKQPPAGSPGGKCAAPDGRCNEAACNREKNYCYDPTDPCRGFFCGGSDRGICQAVSGLPTCSCEPGFHNREYELYCCPEPGIGVDPLCGQGGSASAGAEEGDGDESSGSSGDAGDDGLDR
jgi:hypothetical protein